MPPVHHVRTPLLHLAFEAHGPETGPPVILLHGFPYDPRAYDDVAPVLAAAGHRVLVPYLRGYGPTRFLFPATLRSGQQAALAHDLLDFMDALALPPALLAGFDWGGRAACIVAALWPDRVRALVTCGGYNIQDIAAAATPRPPEAEHRLWYQYYFNTERGRAGLHANRAELSRLLWRQWSPTWHFDDATHARTAASFDNPDFTDTVIHSYRHRFAYAAGDPAYDETERRLAACPPIPVPTINLAGDTDGVAGPLPHPDPDAPRFTGPYERRGLQGIGHNPPQEAPGALTAALQALSTTPPTPN